MKIEKHDDIIVHKFGGSSLIDASSYQSVVHKLTGKREVIVVSAIKGTTSALQRCLDLAGAGEGYRHELEMIEKRHLDIIEDLLSKTLSMELIQSLGHDISRINAVLHAISIVKDYSEDQQALIVGFGEQWSAKILTAYLDGTHKVLFLNAASVLFTRKKRGNIYIDWKRSESAIADLLKDKSFDQLVITGFIACDSNAKQITLGRNCSDFSAAIFSKLFNAKELIIWKDTDGLFSADPSLVSNALPIEHISYESALELAYFGAAVIHPKTIAPAMEQNIPIYIKNSANPSAKGTLISSQAPSSALSIQGITSINNVALISIEGTGLIGVSGTAARVFSALEQTEISVILISQASSEHSICFVVEVSSADKSIQVLMDAFEFEIAQQQVTRIIANKNCAILAVVGDNMVGTIGITGKLALTLAKANVNINAIAQGSSERNISMVVEQRDINKALLAVHAGFYLSNKVLSIGLIGPGLVGKTLLKQIEAELHRLEKQHNVKLEILGICNSSSMLLSDETIDLSRWEELLSNSKLKTNITAFLDNIATEDNPHAVIIDCSANQFVADQYASFIDKGVHVITPNKRANSGDFAYYQKLKQLLRKKSCHYLYETTVCAGLPVITTLHDIIQTGDEVLRIEAVVSGTLSYIFNELSQGSPFSKIIYDAKNKGFTEPDPRDDLAGTDIARKMVILSRELGHSISLEDVSIESLVPPALSDCDAKTFLTELPKFDDSIAASINAKIMPGEQAAYVGSIEKNGTVKVEIKSFPTSHPFARLKGTDNILIFTTRRYHDQPLIIQGPGAGAEVTAAGIFADLLRLVSYIAN